VRFLGQDKGQGPKVPKPLSAHLFFWPVEFSGWAKQSARLPIAPKKTAGPNRVFGPKGLFWGFWA